MELTFRRMDEALRQRGREEPATRGMGTTLTGAYTVGPEAFLGHVGDSRAYLYWRGGLAQLTRDHTLAQDYLDAGLPVPSRSWHHILTNCLGGGEHPVRLEFHHLRLADGDQLLLCTDGLTDLVGNEEIGLVLGGHAHPPEAARALVELALGRGGTDNVTVVLARYALQEQRS
jgi:protein phosphatase